MRSRRSVISLSVTLSVLVGHAALAASASLASEATALLAAGAEAVETALVDTAAESSSATTTVTSATTETSTAAVTSTETAATSVVVATGSESAEAAAATTEASAAVDAVQTTSTAAVTEAAATQAVAIAPVEIRRERRLVGPAGMRRQLRSSTGEVVANRKTPRPTTTVVPTAPAPAPAPAPVVEAPAPAPVVEAPAPAPVVAGLDVRTFGAVGDGTTDDTAALQRAFSTVPSGSTVLVPAGHVFRHTAVVKVTVPGVTVKGGGTLLATNEALSSVWLAADRVVLQDVTLKMGTTTKRWDAYEQMKLRVAGFDGVVVRNVTVDGAASAGIYVGSGASNFLLEDVTVNNSRSDGIHMTTRVHHGVVRRATVIGSGDDGIAVVSYENDGGVSHHILVEDSSVSSNVWGRAFSVVGGEDVTFRNVKAHRSNAASLYIATEPGPYYTLPVRRVRVEGMTITEANTNSAVDHGAIVVWAGRAGMTEEDVLVSDVTIARTRSSAARQVSVLSNGGSVAGVRFIGVAITGGPSTSWYSQVPAAGTSTIRWTKDGVALADRTGAGLV